MKLASDSKYFLHFLSKTWNLKYICPAILSSMFLLNSKTAQVNRKIYFGFEIQQQLTVFFISVNGYFQTIYKNRMISRKSFLSMLKRINGNSITHSHSLDWLLVKFHNANEKLVVLPKNIGVFPKWEKFSLNSANSGNQINYWSINWAQFKDPVPHICCAGTVVACWSLTQEVAGVRILLL